MAYPHGASDAHLALEAAPRGATVRLDLALRDLDALLGLDADRDGTITAGEAQAREADVQRAALAAIRFDASARPCRPGPMAHAYARRADGVYAVMRFVLDCGGPAAQLEIDYRLFADLDATHRALVSVRGGTRLQLLRPGEGPRRVDLAVGPPIGADAAPAGAVSSAVSSAMSGTAAHAASGTVAPFADFFADGLRHILDGIDHLAFVLALAIAAVAVAAREHRSLRPTLIELLGIVTLFTLAHSLTLALVAFERIVLPARLIESLIAASVAYAGVQVWRASRRGVGVGGAGGNGGGAVGGRDGATPRWLVFAFGLVHGFGFGSALADAGLGGRPALAALLAFNLGVEAGQLGVLAVALPLLWAVRARPLFRGVLQPVVAVALVAAGAAWLLERAFALPLAAQWARLAAG